MTKKRRGWSIAVFVLSLLTVGITIAAPSLPHSFYGSATINGNPAPQGTQIVATLDGANAGEITTASRGGYGGPGGFDKKLLVQGDGSTVEFFVNGVPANATASYSSGAVTELNLAWSLPKQLNQSNSPGDSVENESVAVTPDTSVSYNFGDEAEVQLRTREATVAANVRNISKVDNATEEKGTRGVGDEKSLNTYEVDVRGPVAVTITLSYDDAGIDEGTVHPYFHNGTGWERIPDARVTGVDTDANTVTFRVPTARTPYSVFAEPSSDGGGGTTTTGGGGGGGGGIVDSYDTGESVEDTGAAETDTSAEENAGTGSEELSGDEAPAQETQETEQRGADTDQLDEDTEPVGAGTEQGQDEPSQEAADQTGPLGAVLGPVGDAVSTSWFWIGVLVVAGLLTGYLSYRYTRPGTGSDDYGRRDTSSEKYKTRDTDSEGYMKRDEDAEGYVRPGTGSDESKENNDRYDRSGNDYRR